MKQIVECVPNFSEGRDASKIDAIVGAILQGPGVFLLDRSSDADHNRSVITFAGEPERVREAAVRGIGKAAELIDLTKHTGAHPRIGATDVVPFVPVSGITLLECVALAKAAAQEIWDRYRIPVYLYEAAAQRPERTGLENIRKGQFEGLREEVLRNPDRAPDFGDAGLHPTAGATVVGARKFLIAYNINLDTPDIEVAKRIAKSIRFSSGGLPFVKAMGVDLRGRGLAQVSMNLTDFEQMPIHRVFEEVKRQAAQVGVRIAGSEIVGLIPVRAIEMAADFYLQLENFSPAQVLENRLEDSLLKASEKSAGGLAALASPFLEALGEPTPAPGGGSAAALAGALGASLGRMVAGLSRKKKSLAGHGALFETLLAEFQAASQALAAEIDRDAASYQAVIAAQRLPHETAEESRAGDAAIQRALAAAIEAPLEVARRSAEVFAKLGQLEAVSSPSMLSDVRVGRLLASAAVRGALENVAINLESVTDAAFVARIRTEAASLGSRITEGTPRPGR